MLPVLQIVKDLPVSFQSSNHPLNLLLDKKENAERVFIFNGSFLYLIIS